VAAGKTLRPSDGAKRLGLRQSSAALETGPPIESGRGLPQSKTWRNLPSAFQNPATVLSNLL